MMHSLFLLQQRMQKFRQPPACHLQSWRCALPFLTNCSSHRKDFEPGTETQDNYCNSETEIYQKALKCVGKQLGGIDDRGTSSATSLLKPVTPKGCSRGAVPCPEPPALLLRMDKSGWWGVWCRFTPPAPTRLTGLLIPAKGQRLLQLTRSSPSPCDHLDAPLVIITDPFLPRHGGLGGGMRRYPLAALPWH